MKGIEYMLMYVIILLLLTDARQHILGVDCSSVTIGNHWSGIHLSKESSNSLFGVCDSKPSWSTCSSWQSESGSRCIQPITCPQNEVSAENNILENSQV